MDQPPLSDLMPAIQVAATVCATLGVVTCLAGLFGPARLRSIKLALVVLTWISYGIYEYLIPQGLRYDLIVFIPLLIVVTGVGVGVFFLSKPPA